MKLCFSETSSRVRPYGFLELAARTSHSRSYTGLIHYNSPDSRHIANRLIPTNPAVVFFEDYIKDPMHLILHLPTVSNSLCRQIRGRLQRTEMVLGLLLDLLFRYDDYDVLVVPQLGWSIILPCRSLVISFIFNGPNKDFMSFRIPILIDNFGVNRHLIMVASLMCSPRKRLFPFQSNALRT